ncbi:hypothetical protein A4A49_60105 [Nicotiana attenuata]|uniref:Uncharacterized protein n=1 Tax=Nicotiana attenuata TaxID=49451 RepID=A0A1J6J028_NICAT|nr:hypothetical protein A4A49_60105 [Nicotiana attenuata]
MCHVIVINEHVFKVLNRVLIPLFSVRVTQFIQSAGGKSQDLNLDQCIVALRLMCEIFLIAFFSFPNMNYFILLVTD